MKLSMFEEEELATISSRTKLIFKFHQLSLPRTSVLVIIALISIFSRYHYLFSGISCIFLVLIYGFLYSLYFHNSTWYISIVLPMLLADTLFTYPSFIASSVTYSFFPLLVFLITDCTLFLLPLCLYSRRCFL